jgi:hypothetical protein
MKHNQPDQQIGLYVGGHRGDGVASHIEMFPDAHWYVYEPASENVAELANRFRNHPRVMICPNAVVPDRSKVKQARLHHFGYQHGSDSLAQEVSEQSRAVLESTKYPRGHFSLRGFENVITTDLPNEIAMIAHNASRLQQRFRIVALITDCQGLDLSIVKSVRQWLVNGEIEHMQCEVDHDYVPHYTGWPEEFGEVTNAVSAWREFFRGLPYEASSDINGWHYAHETSAEPDFQRDIVFTSRRAISPRNQTISTAVVSDQPNVSSSPTFFGDRVRSI